MNVNQVLEVVGIIYINQWSSVGFISWVWLKNIHIIFAIATRIHSLDIHFYAKIGNKILD